MDEWNLEELGPPPPYEEIATPLTLPKLYPSRTAGKPRTSTVTKDQCAAHLKLLAVLAGLRRTVSSQDGLFGLWDIDAMSTAQANRPNLLARIKEKRWAVYTSRAVDRYWRWWLNCVPNSSPRPKVSALRNKSYLNVTRAPPISLDRDFMPPLDVLMVWHSHMLNPRAFLEDCIRYGKLSFWATEFPLTIINDCIDDRNLAYRPGGAAEDQFMSKTRRSWHNQDDPNLKVLECPLCGKKTEVPWSIGDCSPLKKDNTFACHRGFADRNFKASCNWCGFSITHEALKVANFRDDLRNLLQYDRPMPGTYYNTQGMPEGVDVEKDWLNSLSHLYPNMFLKVIGKEVLRSTRLQNTTRQTMSHVLNEIHRLLNDRSTLRRVSNRPYLSALAPSEKEVFCRMISSYWDNTSRFSMDLAGAVVHQGTFVEKMDRIDWLHSPNVMEIMDRLIEKYKVFFMIMVKHPYKLAVPTLDVDLAWHTHQLSAFRYYEYSTFQTSQENKFLPIFIDHGEKIEEDKLCDSFKWTCATYSKLTRGLIYSQCNCWYCEVTRGPEIENKTSRTSLSSLFSSSSSATNRAYQASRATNIYDSRHISPDPDKNAHISAHNALPMGTTLSSRAAMRTTRNKELQVKYEGACRRAGKPVNKPVNFKPPSHAPYMSDPGIHSDAYASDPLGTNWSVRRSCASLYGGGDGGGHGGGPAGGVSTKGGYNPYTGFKAGAIAGAVAGAAGAAASGGGGGGGGGGF